MHSRIVEVDNARENVKKGVIQGVLGTETPQGRITSRLKYLPTLNPYSDWGLVAYRAAFPIFPEPEIYFPAGTDMRLELTASMPLKISSPLNLVREFSQPEKDALTLQVQTLPDRTSTPKGQDADAINLVFLGSREQLESLSRLPDGKIAIRFEESCVRQFHAFLALKSYSTEPMSQQLLEGRASDITRQKSLNSYAKRDHSRIWSIDESWDGEQAWAAPGTRDTSAVLSVRRRR